MSVDDPHNLYLSNQLQNQKEKLDDLRREDADLLWNFARVAEKDMATSTVIQYLSKLRAISENADRPLEEMTPRGIDGVLDDMQDDRG